MSEANSELLLLFLKAHGNIDQKIAPRIERKRDSNKVERSENQGQFLICLCFLIIFKYFLMLLDSLESFNINSLRVYTTTFSDLYDNVFRPI